MKRLLVVFNPVAGRRRHAALRQTLSHLEHAGYHVTTETTHGPGHAEAIAAGSRDKAFDMLVVAGGDGTFNEVVNGMFGSSLPLALYPMGTANVLAAEINMPADPLRFVRTLASTAPQPAWLGEIAGRRFALMAGSGFDAQVVAAVNARTKRHIGKAAFLVAAAHQLARHSPARFRVDIDGVDHDAAAVVIAKGRYYAGRMAVAPGARITSPELHVCLFHGERRRDLVGYGLALAGGHLQARPDVTVVAGQEVRIAGADGQPVQVDGDIRVHTPFTARVSGAPIMLVMA